MDGSKALSVIVEVGVVPVRSGSQHPSRRRKRQDLSAVADVFDMLRYLVAVQDRAGPFLYARACVSPKSSPVQ
ncbi:hypothetical protein BHE74_00003833 [Ensete ventricosum]|nr:hypothetical protein BHE74_00003833 [Ensete ventricosum]